MTVAYLQIKDVIKEIDLYDVNQNVAIFSQDGSPIKEEFFLREELTSDGKRLFVIRDVGFNPGDVVKCIYTKAAIKKISRDSSHKNHFLATFTYGKTGAAIPEKLESILFKITPTKQVAPFEVLETGDIEQVEFYTLTIPTTNNFVNLPSSFLEAAPAKDVEKQRIMEMVGEIVRNKSANTDAQKGELMRQYRECLTKQTALTAKLRDINTKDLNTYILQELNGRSRSTDQIYQDARVVNVHKIDHGLRIETMPLYAVVQDLDVELRVCMGPLMFDLLDGIPPRAKYNASTPLGQYPHVMDSGSGEICTGKYSSTYAQALAKKDYTTCFEIAVEVMTHVNLNSALSTERWVGHVPGAAGLWDRGHRAQLKQVLDEWNVVQEKNFSSMQKVKVVIPKNFSDTLVKEVVAEFYS